MEVTHGHSKTESRSKQDNECQSESERKSESARVRMRAGEGNKVNNIAWSLGLDEIRATLVPQTSTAVHESVYYVIETRSHHNNTYL